MVQIRKIYHRDNFQIGIYFGFEEDLKQKARSIYLGLSHTLIHKIVSKIRTESSRSF